MQHTPFDTGIDQDIAIAESHAARLVEALDVERERVRESHTRDQWLAERPDLACVEAFPPESADAEIQRLRAIWTWGELRDALPKPFQATIASESPDHVWRANIAAAKDRYCELLRDRDAREKELAKHIAEQVSLPFETKASMAFLPAWLFDYPDQCYIDRQLAVEAIHSPEFEWPEAVPLGTCVLAQRLPAMHVDRDALIEAVALAERLVVGAPSRPRLFLHVVDRFCQSSMENRAFAGDALRGLLFEHGRQTPLATFDPLATIDALIDALEAVSRPCMDKAMRFQSFRLVGPSVLQGRKQNGDWQTVLAYCGGWRTLPSKTKVRCGQAPLYLGQDESCENCGRLIWHQCGFCGSQCPECARRQQSLVTATDDV